VCSSDLYLEEADKLADQIAVLDRGKIIALGKAAELKQKFGTERVEVVIDPKSDFKKAEKVVTGTGLQKNEKKRSISVSTNGTVQEIKRVLDAIYDSGVDLQSMSVHKPTLDDVFLELTGREVTAEEELVENNKK